MYNYKDKLNGKRNNRKKNFQKNTVLDSTEENQGYNSTTGEDIIL